MMFKVQYDKSVLPNYEFHSKVWTARQILSHDDAPDIDLNAILLLLQMSHGQKYTEFDG